MADRYRNHNRKREIEWSNAVGGRSIYTETRDKETGKCIYGELGCS